MRSRFSVVKSISVPKGDRRLSHAFPDDAETEVVELRDGSRLRLDQRAENTDVFHRLAEKSRDLQRPLFVEHQDEYDGQARSVLLSKRRRIIEIGEEHNRMVPIIFEVSHAQTFIDLDGPSGTEMLVRAHEAIARNVSVDFVMRAVNAEIAGLEIVTGQAAPLEVATLRPAPKRGTKDLPLSGAELDEAYRICAGLDYIPFAYPGDCCAYRAWEMRRVLNEMDFECGKVFLYPERDNALRVATDNHPDGHVCWTYHVAPIVYLKKGSRAEPCIIDPSLFGEPVTQQQWIDRQPHKKPDGGRRLYKETSGDVFFRARGAEATEVDRSPIDGHREPGNLADESKAVKLEFLIHYGEKIDLHLRTGPYKRGC